MLGVSHMKIKNIYKHPVELGVHLQPGNHPLDLLLHYRPTEANLL
jgi:hypothetical protein